MEPLRPTAGGDSIFHLQGRMDMDTLGAQGREEWMAGRYWLLSPAVYWVLVTR